MNFSVTNRLFALCTEIGQTLSLGSRGVILGHVLSVIVVTLLFSFPAAIASASRLDIRICRCCHCSSFAMGSRLQLPNRRLRSRDTLSLLLRRHLSQNSAPQLFSVSAHLRMCTLFFIVILVLVASRIPRCPRACPLLRHLRAWRIQ